MKTCLLLLIAVATSAIAQIPMDPSPVSQEKPNLEGFWTRDEGKWHGAKHFFQGIYGVSYFDKNTHVIIKHMGGRYSFSESSLKEYPRFTTPNWNKLRVDTMPFKIAFTGTNIFKQSGKENSKETWVRAVTANGESTLGDVVDFSDKVTDLDGVWTLKNSDDQIALKVFDKGRIATTQFNPKTKDVLNHSIGIFSLSEGVLRERIIYTTENWKEMIGSTLLWEIKMNKKSFSQTGTKGNVQTWFKVD